MSLTTQQQTWYDKISHWVPGWMFQEKDQSNCISVAVFAAIAAMFSGIEDDARDNSAAILYGNATTPVLDLEASELDLTRNTGEGDPSLRGRMRYLTSTPDEAFFQNAIDAVLNTGTAFLIADEQYGYLDDIFALSDPYSRLMDGTRDKDYFAVIIPEQSPGTDATVQAALLTLFATNKAYGIGYDVLYKTSTDTDGSD